MSLVVLHDDLIPELLSFLPVKSLMRLKCVCKSWNTLISNISFVKLHLQRSPRRHLLLTDKDEVGGPTSFIPFPVCSLVGNKTITVAYQNDCCQVVGSCNGLLCLLGYSSTDDHDNIWFRLWNPATGTVSEKLGSFLHPLVLGISFMLRFSFGYDNSSSTYKVVALDDRDVRVFSLRDEAWRNIPSFPDDVVIISKNDVNEGVHLSGTINWLAIRNNVQYKDFRDVTFVIISLDLGTETYKHLLAPPDFDKVPFVEPTIAVLMDSLCITHHFKRTHFVIWQMTEFGVEQSWTQLFKISYQNLQVDHKFDDLFHRRLLLFPLCLSENGDTLILANTHEDQAIIYNLRDDTVKRTTIINQIKWFLTKDYVESLVPTS